MALSKPSSSKSGNKRKADSSQRRPPPRPAKKPVSRPSAADERISMKTAQSKVFPVVLRIKQEIDFCFSSFYGDLSYDSRVCERQFAKWVSRGHRGPGELAIYIEMLAAHLAIPTQQSIFRNLANDCISVIKKNKPQQTTGGFLSKYRFQIMLNIGILLLMVAVFYIGKLAGS